MPLPLADIISKITFIIVCLLSSSVLHAQEKDSTGVLLPLVQIRAFERNQRYIDAPVSLGVITSSVTRRFNPSSVVHAMNTIPGVKMEERSPGSYRLNIRGSSLRSPFGVRNVKIYFNDLLITDPGGQTYLNAFASSHFRSVEIIRGPGSSLYGAGTGGVLLIEAVNTTDSAGLLLTSTVGSFGQKGIEGIVRLGSGGQRSQLTVDLMKSDGYRNHSALERTNLSWLGHYRLFTNSVLKTSFFYGDLFYKTPGALTLAEYSLNPRSARPQTGAAPGSESAGASIDQKTVLAGFSVFTPITPAWSNKTSLQLMHLSFTNPTIRNYEKTAQPAAGGRTVFAYNKNGLRLLAGAEWQEGRSSLSVFQNRAGQADTLQSVDEIKSGQQLLFTQIRLEINRWSLEGGISGSLQRLRIERFSPAPSGKINAGRNTNLSPRIALVRKLGTPSIDATLYASLSQGFSPPTNAEVFPSGGAINRNLRSEKGWNYEAGIKSLIARKLYFEIVAFYFALQNSIVLRRTAAGGDYFINAGRTKQLGIETLVSYDDKLGEALFYHLSASYTRHRFTYKNFIQNTTDFSGKRLPGTPPHAFNFAASIRNKSLEATINYYFNSSIALNDANTQFAASYHLLSARVSRSVLLLNKLQCTVAVGADNLLQQEYSLGNDINGFGNRYYNAGPGRSFFGSLIFDLQFTETNTRK